MSPDQIPLWFAIPAAICLWAAVLRPIFRRSFWIAEDTTGEPSAGERRAMTHTG